MLAPGSASSGNATLGVAVPGGGVAGGTGKNLKRLRFVFLKHCLCHAIYESVGVDLSQKDEEGEIQFRVSRNQRRDGVLQGKFLVVPANDSIDDDDDIDGSATLRSFDEKYDGTFSVSKLDRADFNDFNDDDSDSGSSRSSSSNSDDESHDGEEKETEEEKEKVPRRRKEAPRVFPTMRIKRFARSTDVDIKAD